MVFKLKTSLLGLGLALVHVACQSMQKVCDDKTSVCFQQLTDPHTNTTIGMILPPVSGRSNASNSDEAIYKITSPLPYGFAGFAFSESLDSADLKSGISQSSMLVFETRIMTNGQIGTAQTVFITQNSVLSKDGTAYIPASDTEKTMVVSFSAQATYATDDQFTSVFRCQNCVTSFKPGSSLTIIRSDTPPIYPSPTAFNATLPLKGVVTSRIAIADETSLRSEQYSAYAKALGV